MGMWGFRAAPAPARHPHPDTYPDPTAVAVCPVPHARCPVSPSQLDTQPPVLLWALIPIGWLR